MIRLECFYVFTSTHHSTYHFSLVTCKWPALPAISDTTVESPRIRQRLIQRAFEFGILLALLGMLFWPVPQVQKIDDSRHFAIAACQDDVAITHLNFSPEYEKASHYRVFSFFFFWNSLKCFLCGFFVSCSYSGPELRIYMIYAFGSPLKLSTFWGVADPWFGCKESTISTICQQKIHLVLETEAPSISCSSDWWFPLPAFFSMFPTVLVLVLLLSSSSLSSFWLWLQAPNFFIVYPPQN